ncbi:Hypothetical Protein FCC1311_014372 [Hondaea fermentalgiana]|uniref:Uncharacterized protein n=1 Tax=Hondaea fermentalgiana TaxID=2315210 RepID=A0A2R5G2J6_9STRA|nr:Hypothetical Protein FCC1311_014372 [Hondaea fermentalgiana]|eukprot:GBG25220.1 Hypothetical Protein FCC1311_014372 [Hondaea fermentalgiana]
MGLFKVVMSLTRREALAYLKGDCTGYNIITGDRPATSAGVRTRKLYPSYGKPEAPRGRRHFDQDVERPQTRCLGEYAQLKFFQEQKESEVTQFRRKILAKDGLSRSVKRSAVIGYGRGDLSSRGVADNFMLKQL